MFDDRNDPDAMFTVLAADDDGKKDDQDDPTPGGDDQKSDTKPGDNKGSEAEDPGTGDDSRVMLWFGVLAGALLGLGLIAVASKKKKK